MINDQENNKENSTQAIKENGVSIPETWHNLKSYIDHFDEKKNLEEWLYIYAVTWNMNGKIPSKENVSKLLLKNSKYLVYAIGTEESMRSIFRSIFYSNKQEWIRLLSEVLGNDFIYLQEENLSAIHLVLFVHKSIRDQISNISSSYIKTGFANLMGNKGAVAINFKIKEKSIAIINCHLAAGHSNISDRNNHFLRINFDLRFPNIAEESIDNQKSMTSLFDICIWMGDLNYRVELDIDEAKEYLDNHEIENMIENDQFINEQIIGFNVDNFFEGKIEFMPTYKYKIGSDSYDFSDRVPSWTDRIIYKSKLSYDLIQLEYRAINDIRVSDHKPVFSVFKVLINDKNTDNKSNSEIKPILNSSDFSTHNNGSPFNFKSSICSIY